MHQATCELSERERPGQNRIVARFEDMVQTSQRLGSMRVHPGLAFLALPQRRRAFQGVPAAAQKDHRQNG